VCAQEEQHLGRLVRGARRQPQGQPAGGAPRRPAARAAQARRGRREHLAERVVELPDAAETGGEGDVGHGEVGRLDEQARGLCALGPRESERTDAELAHEQAVQLPV
jgi:hypothetical protein